jgi:drug/metabolite transporter (DMT)-like permease
MIRTWQTQPTSFGTLVATDAPLSTQGTFRKKLMLPVVPANFIWTGYALRVTVMSAALWRSHTPGLWGPRKLKLQLLCGVLIVGGSLREHCTLQCTPAIEGAAFYFLVPLAAILLALWVLKENVAWLGWLNQGGASPWR